MALQRKAITDTGDEKKVISRILRARRYLDSVGGTLEADKIRKDVDELLTKAYLIMVGGR